MEKRYKEFAEYFQKMSDEQLINSFNKEVGNHGWVGARALYLAALRDEFKNRDFDPSVISSSDGGFSLATKIKLIDKKIVLDK